MKFYLYELGENLNNILSTESVSPCSFYKLREFGYKYLENRSAVHLDNVIILFSKPVIIRSRNEYYDPKHFPIVIEISINSINDSEALIDITDKCKGLSNNIRVFAYPKTIFFSALTDKFYFRNNDVFSWAKNTSDKSIETKLYSFYERCGAFIKSFESLNGITEINSDTFSIDGFNLYDYDPKKEALKDKHFDRLKGAVYGYLFGLASSLPKTEQLSWKNYKELVNYASLSINKKQLNENVELYAKKLMSTFPQEFLQNLDRYMIALKNYVTALSKEENQKYLSHSQELFDSERTIIEEMFRNYFFSNQIKRKSFGIDNIPKVDKNNRVTFPYDQNEYSAYDRKLVNDVINLILDDYGSITAEGSDDKGNLIKRICFDCLIPLYSKEAWNKTKLISKNNLGINEFRLADDLMINKLLQNILNSTPFDYSELDNKPDLLSLCASISYMTKDLLSFSRHLYSLNITNLSVPFALWGALYGYSAFDKRYSELFYSSERFDDLKKIYSILLSNGKISKDVIYDETLYSQEDKIRREVANQIVNSMESGVSKLNDYYLNQTKILNDCKQEITTLRTQNEELSKKLDMVSRISKEHENKKMLFEEENNTLRKSIDILKDEIAKQNDDIEKLKNTSNTVSSDQQDSLSISQLWSDFVNKVTNKNNPKLPSLFEKNFKNLSLKIIDTTEGKNKQRKMKVKEQEELCTRVQKLMKDESPQHFGKKLKEIYPSDVDNNKKIEESIYELIKELNVYADNKFEKLLTEFCSDLVS